MSKRESERAMVSLDQILDDFEPSAAEKKSTLKNGAPVTIWLPAEEHARFRRIQDMSGRKFSKKLREILIAAIELAESKAS